MNKKIDGRKHYVLAIDTETAGSLESPLVYDIGASVMDTKGNMYESLSSVVYEIYCKEKEKMASAYYAKKLPEYEQGIEKGHWTIMKFFTIRKILREWIEEYGITEIVAYNTRFDRKALNNTMEYLTEGKFKWFFPYGIEYLDIWNMACSTIYKKESYYQMAKEHGWESDAGNVRTNAEVGYSYLSGESFEEKHTALEDVKIEYAIYLACLKARVKAEDKVITHNPWRKPQKGWKEYKIKIA